MSFILEQHAYRLLQDEPFFAAMSRAVHKVCNRGIPTAGVCVNPHTAFFELHYNPDFLESLGQTDSNGEPITEHKKILDRRDDEIRAVLKHEFYHLIFEHVTGRLPSEGMSKLWNIATDLAINSEIGNTLPYTSCMPGREYKNPENGNIDPGFKDYPHHKSSEYYYEMLKKDPRSQQKQKSKSGENSQDGEGNSGIPDTLDDHSQWCGEGTQKPVDSVVREIAKERIKDAIRDAVNESIKSGMGWGKVSAEMQKEIISRLSSTIDWRTQLRYFVKTSQKADKMSTMRKINRRYPYIHSGKKTNRTAKLAISIDQSGSVGDEMLEAFFAELNGLSEIADFTVIPFDDRVFEEKIYVWKKGQKRRKERVLCGGTNFDAPTDYVNEHSFDGHIILTDLMAPKPKNSKCQRMWMTTEDCAKSPYFATQEKIVAIRPNRK